MNGKKALIKKEENKNSSLSIAIGIFSYFHYHYHYLWKSEFCHTLQEEERRESGLWERLAKQGMLEELAERREKRKENEKPMLGRQQEEESGKWRGGNIQRCRREKRIPIRSLKKATANQRYQQTVKNWTGVARKKTEGRSGQEGNTGGRENYGWRYWWRVEW
jgi:hypothetical protein